MKQIKEKIANLYQVPVEILIKEIDEHKIPLFDNHWRWKDAFI